MNQHEHQSQNQSFNMQPLEYEPSYVSSYTFRDQYAPMRVGQWIVVLIATLLPGINVLLLLFWAFFGSINKNLQNYSRAVLLLMLTGALLLGLAVAYLRLSGGAIPLF